MDLEEALAILRKGGRVYKKLCDDTGITFPTLNRILKGETKNPHYSTAVKIIKWVEEN